MDNGRTLHGKEQPCLNKRLITSALGKLQYETRASGHAPMKTNAMDDNREKTMKNQNDNEDNEWKMMLGKSTKRATSLNVWVPHRSRRG
ncbi:hypothetical protein KIN20_011699 [Parelaphostrongylus tenuis]|uniref:Uncharacterized protein n=1 Tax=Parelaphostrongylus tenuis TaxID=148309 RepID=A0AAD5MD99_PARTN|nr:hypothetical protein KIN20_011699 [Parelaphostrongylus tenuis]